MCQICNTTGTTACRDALTTEDALRARITNRIATTKYFATLLFGLFLSSFLSGALDTFEGAMIALEYLVTTARQTIDSGTLSSTTILRRRLSFLESISNYLDIAKLRWDGTKEGVDFLTLGLMDPCFEQLIQSLDELITAEIRDEVESQFDDFGLGGYLSDGEDVVFKPLLKPEIDERVAEAEVTLLEHLEKLGREDQGKRDARAGEELPLEEEQRLWAENQEAILNLDPEREIVLLSEEDIFGL